MAGVEDFPPEGRRDRMKQFAKRAVPVPLWVRTSDLPKRAASAVVLVLAVGAAFWAGGRVLDLFFVAVGLVCFGEFARLVLRGTDSFLLRLCGLAFGSAYIGYAVYLLTAIDKVPLLVLLFGAVASVDTFAYFFGRTLGGPKIAPRISPSKTWAGLLGGVVGASVAFLVYALVVGERSIDLLTLAAIVLFGSLVAVVAQAGDFFESWLKRKAGMKDSSNLIPGHGGVFDRIDGLIPVVILIGTLEVWSLALS